MKIADIKFKFGPFRVTITARRVREYLSTVIVEQVNWLSLRDKLIQQGVSPLIAGTVTDCLKSELLAEIAGAE